MATLFLAGGHGGTDPGAVGNGTNERDLTIELINKAVAILSSQNLKGNNVVVVPHNLNLIDEINWINANSKNPGNDLCIEVHLNAGGGQGIETWFYSGIQVSADFANEIQIPLVSFTGLANRGIKGDATNRWGRLGFIRDTAPLAALIELGFIDNANDVAVVKDKGALALAAAILNTWGSAYVAPLPPVVPPAVTPVETPKEPPKVPETPVIVPTENQTPVKVDAGLINKVLEAILEFFKRLFGGK
jgi:N-acetylmuramoyl-L-alanine amidase